MSPILGIIASSKFAAVGDFESIATVTVGSGGAANVEFTSIPATYTHLQIRAIHKITNTGNDSVSYNLQFNSDTASNYSNHRLSGNGSSASANAGASQSQINLGGINTTFTGTSGMFGVSVIDILEYANTNIYKTTRCLNGWDTNAVDTQNIGLGSGNWRSTSAVSTIKLYPGGGNTLSQYSSFALYGKKSA